MKKPDVTVVKPVTGAAAPEFPKRDSLYQRAGLLVGLGAAACTPAPTKPVETTPTTPVTVAQEPAPKPDESKVQPVVEEPLAKPVEPEPVEPAPPPPPPEPVAFKDGSVDGMAIEKASTPPKFKVYRDGGGIGPPEDMWEPTEVEAFLSFTLAKEGKLNLKSHQKFDYDGVSVTLDAFDAEKKVGYAYVDRWGPDGAMTPAVAKKLDAWMKAKKVAILFIDMKKIPDQATLKGKVLKFLADVKKSPPAAGPL